MDGARVALAGTAAGDPARIRIGRVAGNDLELHSDRTVSGKHAVLEKTGDPNVWRLEDLGSANGTWVDDVLVSGARTIAAGSFFMVAHSVLQLADGSAEESFLPSAETIRGEMARLTARFAPETAEGYGAAVALATAEQRAFIADRHLFFGLAVMNPDAPVLARGKGPISATFLSEVLRRNDYWTNNRAWIDRRLRTSALDVPALFEDELIVTPRLLRLLLAAEEEARRAESEHIRPLDVWRAFFTGPANRPRELLARGGIPPESILPLIPAAPVLVEPGAASPPVPIDEEPVPAAEAPRESAPLPAFSSGDPALDARAQEAARRLYGTASLYHLAAAEDRHRAMKQLLRDEVAQVPAESRSPLLGQLRRLFPVVSGAVEPAGGRVHERTDATKRDFGPVEGPETNPVAGFPWSALLNGVPEADLAGLSPADRPAVTLYGDLLGFATALERFIASIVQDLRTPGLGTESLQLPGYRISIRGFAQELAAGRSPQRAALQEYLSAVETWLIAIVAAYHEGADLWFKDFWARVSPAVIESPLAEENKKKGFGLRPDFWARYKERVRTVSLDLVSDEIRRVVSRRADEQFQLFFERRKPS